MIVESMHENHPGERLARRWMVNGGKRNVSLFALSAGKKLQHYIAWCLCTLLEAERVLRGGSSLKIVNEKSAEIAIWEKTGTRCANDDGSDIISGKISDKMRDKI